MNENQLIFWAVLNIVISIIFLLYSAIMEIKPWSALPNAVIAAAFFFVAIYSITN